MMNLMELGLLTSLGVSLLALGVAIAGLVRTRRQADRLQKLYQRLNRELTLANSGAIGMGQRLVALEKRLQSNDRAGSQAFSEDDSFLPFSQAAELFKVGIDIDEVSRRCGLSRAEASLMAMMQKQAANHA